MTAWITLIAMLVAVISAPWVRRLVPASRGMRVAAWCLPALIAVASAACDHDARRILQFGLMPLGLTWLGLLAAASGAWALGRRRTAVIAAALAALLGIACNQWVGATLIASLENRVDAELPSGDERFDAVCVLGGGATRRFDGASQLGETGDRVRIGAVQFLGGRTPLLVTTGVFASDTCAMWKELGIPVTAVVVEPAPLNTAEEIAAIKHLAEERKWSRIGVVSSAWHLPRALRLAAHAGLALRAMPADWLGAIPPWTAETVLPKAEGIRMVELGLKERLGLWLGP